MSLLFFFLYIVHLLCVFFFIMSSFRFFFIFFFFNDTATTEIYTLSLHDALPILLFLRIVSLRGGEKLLHFFHFHAFSSKSQLDRKSTRLNSSHTVISYAVFCLKKKKTCKPAS